MHKRSCEASLRRLTRGVCCLVAHGEHGDGGGLVVKTGSSGSHMSAHEDTVGASLGGLASTEFPAWFLVRYMLHRGLLNISKEGSERPAHVNLENFAGRLGAAMTATSERIDLMSPHSRSVPCSA